MSERTTLQISIAVTEAESDITDEELRLCIAAQSSVMHFYRNALVNLIEMIREDKPAALLKMKAEFHWGTVDRMFTAMKTPPKKWLGEGGIPGTPEQKERLRMGKAIFKRATGLDL